MSELMRVNDREDVRLFIVAGTRGPINLRRVTHGLEILPTYQGLPFFFKWEDFHSSVCTHTRIYT